MEVVRVFMDIDEDRPGISAVLADTLDGGRFEIPFVDEFACGIRSHVPNTQRLEVENGSIKTHLSQGHARKNSD